MNIESGGGGQRVQCRQPFLACTGRFPAVGRHAEQRLDILLTGQGNAVFGQIEGDEAWNTGLLAELHLSEEAHSVSYRLMKAGKHGISFAEEADGERRLAALYSESEKLCDPVFIREKWDEFCRYNAKWYLPMLLCWGRVRNKLNRMTNNRLIDLFTNQKKRRVVMNLIHCDAHREVIQTILENEQ